MPSPSNKPDDPTKRVRVDAEPVPDRTPDEMLGVLTKMVNRQVAALETIVEANGGHVPIEYTGPFDDLLERVCKLAREDRQREPTDDELLEQHDAKGGETT